jgi:hypothetical protein
VLCFSNHVSVATSVIQGEKKPATTVAVAGFGEEGGIIRSHVLRCPHGNKPHTRNNGNNAEERVVVYLQAAHDAPVNTDCRPESMTFDISIRYIIIPKLPTRGRQVGYDTAP